MAVRTILFRGKRIDNGEWIYGLIITVSSMIHGDAVSAIQERSIDGKICHSSVVDPATVGQYTGLKDKNGKRIFEGDVVEHMVSSFCQDEVDGDIYWHKGHARFGMHTKGCPHYLDSLNTYEIIGNIHDKGAE